ncbi:MAG: DegT/DnrJ/EryC1/StrS family aminotransferase [Actinobacteria bacterium]|nr:DegT/DnrJ/EryC1/StrS family aminotransferase [Actinomycetota bacterium]
MLQVKLSEAFHRVLASGSYILGPEVDSWEREFGDFFGAQYAIGVSSGSDALLLALQALGVGPGDEVIVPTYTFFASAGSVARLGARPVFVDSAPCCYNLSAPAVAQAIGPKTKAIMAVHLFGQAADMESILQVAQKAGLPVVEDVAQALGAKVGDRYAGTLGTVGCFSFFPTKNLGALGEGGMVVTRDEQLAEKLRKLRVHGAKKKYFHEEVGGNFRLHELQAAFLRVKLPRIADWLQQRQRNAEAYYRMFSGSSTARPTTKECVCNQTPPNDSTMSPEILLPFRCNPSHTFNQFVLRISGAGRRDRLREALLARGVGTEVYYPRPLHVQECFRNLGYREGDFPWAERFSRETLALPIYPELETGEIEHVASELCQLAGSL